MSSGTDEFLDHIDEWKAKLSEKLKGMSAAERKAFWRRSHEEARRRGLPVVEADEAAQSSVKRGRRTG